MTEPVAPEADAAADAAPVYYGHIIIEWPAPLRKGEARPLPGWACAIFDAATGKPIVTAEKIFIPAVTAAAQAFITCEMTMFADDQGMPVLFAADDGRAVVWPDGNGRIRTGTFPFLVAEMRVRPAARTSPAVGDPAPVPETSIEPGRG